MKTGPIILFLPASIRSHIMPAMYVADLLKCSYSIYFAVTNDTLRELVEENGFKTIFQSRWRAMLGMENDYIVSKKKQKDSFLNVIKAFKSNDVFKHRYKELARINEAVKPEAVIIDIFSSTDYLVLRTLAPHLKLLFFNPMLSTYKVNGYPLVSESVWIKENVIGRGSTKSTIWNLIKRPKASLLHYLNNEQTQKTLKGADVLEGDFDKQNAFTKMFKGVPELIAAHLEFEVSLNVRQQNQYYLGLCTRDNRSETELDQSFKGVWQNIISDKQKIIYCSFGTFYTGPDRALLNFLNNLLEAIKEIDSVQLIISVNQYIIEAVSNHSASNVFVKKSYVK